MLNYTQFFPISSGGGGGASGAQSLPSDTLADYRNRQVFTGPYTETWPVPDGVTEVEVHVWGGGGGGAGTCYSGGGGGGGYARTRLQVTSADSLAITVGGTSGTSSITVPTQSPGSPVSATGGSNGTATGDPTRGQNPTGYCCNMCLCGGAGGSGSISLASPQPTEYCFTAPGGCGGAGMCACMDSTFPPAGGSPAPSVNWTNFLSLTTVFGSGGAAGSPKGGGGWGTQCNSNEVCYTHGEGGGGIGGHFGGKGSMLGSACQYYICPSSCPSGVTQIINVPYYQGAFYYGGSGGGSFGPGAIQTIGSPSPTPTCMWMCGIVQMGGAGKEANYNLTFQNQSIVNPTCGNAPTGGSKQMNVQIGSEFCEPTPASNEWWRVEDIGGAGGTGANVRNFTSGNPGSSGGGGGGWSSGFGPLQTTPSGGYLGAPCVLERIRVIPGTPGGFLGGGGSGAYVCIPPTWPGTPQGVTMHTGECNGMGGFAGGSNGSAPGTPGVVIIYW